MSRKMIDPVAEGSRGGNITKTRHGVEHFSKIAKERIKKLKKNDPDYFKRLAAAGMYARQVKMQTEIAKMLGEKLIIAGTPSETKKFFNVLMGQG